MKDELLYLVSMTIKEEGCLKYDLHQDLKDDNKFFFYEEWTTQDTLNAHLESDHFKRYSNVTKDNVLDFNFQQLIKL